MLQAKLRQPGIETRSPKGAGQRQRSWLGAKHDSPVPRRGVARKERLFIANSRRNLRQKCRNKTDKIQKQQHV
ncbi:hypothetical protein DVP42_20725 [Yersinia enterocolitica]|nr:hypothetical protein [Yersinia enterocolitica]EKN5956432.1 hypothetical protein [Yersinia enterocolitica]EKN5999196.1 hypothetical protein [Yersinia enterocolitica]